MESPGGDGPSDEAAQAAVAAAAAGAPGLHHLQQQQQQQQHGGGVEYGAAMAVPAAAASADTQATTSGGGATADADAVAADLLLSKVPVARKEEVQRVLGQCLVLPCDPAGPYSAPVVTMSAEESNIYTLVERHFRPEYLLGADRFWRLVRADMGVDTWRPRVQGTQLKALSGARLPESEAELAAVARVVSSLADCLLPESSPELLMGELRTTIGRIQAWWENRNRRPDGGRKRGAPQGPGGVLASKKRMPSGDADTVGAAVLPGLQLLGIEPGQQQQFLGGTADFLVAGVQQGAAAAMAAAAAAAGFTDTTAQQAAGRAGHAAAADATDAAAPLSLLLAGPSPSAPLLLDVGGHRHRTTLQTLLAVPGSWFWRLAQGHVPPHVAQRLPSGELFIDRNGEVFGYVLEYLRAVLHGEPSFPLPSDAREVQALAREASFYQLPSLVEHIACMSISPQSSTRAYYDAVFLETGFWPIEGPGCRDMERHKVLMMQQLNHVIYLRSREGFHVEDVECGVWRREARGGEGGGASAEPFEERQQQQQQQQQQGAGSNLYNLYAKVVFKRVAPLLPVPDSEDDEDGGEEEQEEEDGEQPGVPDQ